MLSAIATFVLRLFGWRVDGTLPNVPKYVIIGAPHTSNWDFFLMVLAAPVLKVKVVWMGKDSLFWWPMGALLRRLGGIAIDRRSRNNVVDQAVAVFGRSERLMMVITPEGTRKKTSAWKSGFYYIALGAQVPILLCYADYAHKVVGVGPLLMPTGDIEADMGRIRAFYSGIAGRHPEQTSDIRIAARDERG